MERAGGELNAAAPRCSQRQPALVEPTKLGAGPPVAGTARLLIRSVGLRNALVPDRLGFFELSLRAPAASRVMDKNLDKLLMRLEVEGVASCGKD
jgi:hypothetical protein